MIINGKQYGFTVLPYWDMVQAVIFKVENFKDGESYNLAILTKEFGSIFRRPIEQDYINARKWAENQMRYIFEANQPTP